MKRSLILRCALVLGVATAVPATAQSASYEVISRCFFVYVAAHEAARDTAHATLFQYTQPRIGWMSGFIAGNQTNEAFGRIFNANIATNKQFATKIDDQIRASILDGNAAAFDAAINATLACDTALGFEAQWRPRLAP